MARHKIIMGIFIAVLLGIFVFTFAINHASVREDTSPGELGTDD